MTQTSVTVVIVSHGRAAWLKRTVESLSDAQTPQVDLSIRVALNGPDANSKKALQELSDETQKIMTITQLKEPVTPAEGRNCLLRDLTCEWVYFIDDDAFVPQEHFLNFSEILEANRNKNLVAIGGPNLTPPSTGSFQKSTGVALSSRFATWASNARYQPEESARPATELDLILCNLFVRADRLHSNSFLKELVCAEENWLLQEISKSPTVFWYSPELFVWHERRASLRSLAKQCFQYGWGRGQMLRRKPTSIRWFHLVPSVCSLFAGVGALLFLFTSAHKEAFALVASVYILACLCSAVYSSISAHVPWLFLQVAMVFPTVHFGYGLGLLRGALWKS
jgi:hypothetical protein